MSSLSSQTYSALKEAQKTVSSYEHQKAVLAYHQKLCSPIKPEKPRINIARKQKEAEDLLEEKVSELLTNYEFLTFFEKYIQSTTGIKEKYASVNLGDCHYFDYSGHKNVPLTQTKYGIILQPYTLRMYIAALKEPIGPKDLGHMNFTPFKSVHFVKALHSPSPTQKLIGLTATQFEKDLEQRLKQITKEIKQRE